MDDNPGFELVGNLEAINDKAKHDKIFDCDVRIFENNGEFRQKIKILSADLKLTGSYEGQVCSEEKGQCVLFSGDLMFGNFNITAGAPDVRKVQPKQQPAAQKELSPDTAKVVAPLVVPSPDGPGKGPIIDPTLVTEDPRTGSWTGFFILAFLAGLAALLTPCVFPMIPMTVSYFTGKGNRRSSAVNMGFPSSRYTR